MKTSIVKDLKTLIYGTIPYIWTSFFSPDSPKRSYYKFLKDYGYTHYPYEFAGKYMTMPIDVKEDKEKKLFYVMHRGNKKLYYPRSYGKEMVEKNYRALLIEQDLEHAHHYVDSSEEFVGKTFLDVGSAEGFTSLDAVEYVRFIYLFEFESKWVEALNATFEPWKEKVVIIEKYVGSKNDALNITLDAFFKDKPKDNLFLKIDIEGAECDALQGAEGLFAEATNLDFAICTYHRRDDKKNISAYLDQKRCTYSLRDGYLYVRHRLRTALIRGYKV